MLARPRRTEREVARHLSAALASYGLPAVERIPVLGRTGPDLTYSSQLPLIVDVKSRLEVPKSFLVPHLVATGRYYLVPLDRLDELIGDYPAGPRSCVSRTVDRWYAHMNEWTRVQVPDGITALVLHRPKMPIGASVLVIQLADRRKFHACFRISPLPAHQ